MMMMVRVAVVMKNAHFGNLPCLTVICSPVELFTSSFPLQKVRYYLFFD